MGKNLTSLNKTLLIDPGDGIDLLTKFIIDLGFTLNDVATFSGVSRAVVDSWIRGEDTGAKNTDFLRKKITKINKDLENYVVGLEESYGSDLTPIVLNEKIKKIKNFQRESIKVDIDKEKSLLIESRIKKKIEAEKIKAENQAYKKNFEDFKRLVGKKILQTASIQRQIEVTDFNCEISKIEDLITDRGFSMYESGYADIRSHPEAFSNEAYKNPKSGEEKVLDYQRSGATKYQKDIIEYLDELKAIIENYKNEMMSLASPEFKFINYLITIETKLNKCYPLNEEQVSLEKLLSIARFVITPDPSEDLNLIHIKKGINVMNMLNKISNIFNDDKFEVQIYKICWSECWPRYDDLEDIYEAPFMNWLGSSNGSGFISSIRTHIENSMYANRNSVHIKLNKNMLMDEDGNRTTSYILDSFLMPFKLKYIQELFIEYGYKVKILVDVIKNKEKSIEISW